jgi:16S rRNA (guanine966-N2)-methyltransferase
MSLRIAAGRYKNHTLPSVDGAVTRPTTEFLRNTVFSVLDNHAGVEDTLVLDLYAGSGAFGFEAVSRGAKYATLVDVNQKAVGACIKAVKSLKAEHEFKVVQQDALHFLAQCNMKFDLVFADPPYHLHVCNKVCQRLIEHDVLNNNALVVCEHGPSEFLMPPAQFVTVWRKELTSSTVQILSYSAE